jgi:hypothetical protein
LVGNVQSCDIGVDVMGFAPVRRDAIKAHLATLPLTHDLQARGQIDDPSNGGPKP